MPNPETTRMFTEAGEAADAVSRQLAASADTAAELGARLRAQPPVAAVTYARGSSDHAATFGKYLIETQLGCVTSSAALSVSSVYDVEPAMRGMLALGISQSGASPDIVAGVEAAGRSGATTVAMVNVAGSPLARSAEWELPLHAGPERSVAATKSYIAALAALVQLAAAWNEDAALAEALAASPELLREAWVADWSPLVEALVPARGLFVIGRGLGFGVAQEAALKFKETCGLHAEAFSAAEVRHGPMALVGPDFPLLVFRQSDATAEGVDAMVAEMRGRGAPVFVVGDAPAGAVALPAPGAHGVIEPLLQIQAFYRAANALSVARGHDPDRPPHLAKVTETV